MSNKGKSTKIVLNRQSDLILTGAKIEAPVGIVLEDIKGVQETFEKEAKTREAADAKLQDQINNVLSNVDPESLDSLTEIVDAFKGADKDLNGAISDLAKTASSALKNEANEREAADEKEAKERQSADEKEARIREAADDKLQVQIDNVLSNVDPESLDSLTEVVEAFKVADKDLNGAISSLAKTASSALKKEADEREAADAELAKGLAEEIKRATKAEEGLDSKIADIISNTDLSSIDSFSEVVANLDATNERVDTEYYKKLNVNQAPDGILKRFTFSTWSRSSSESIFLNGLLLTEKEDYSVVFISKKIAAVDFYDAPQYGDKIKAYGVYATDAVSVADIRAQIAKLEMELNTKQAEIEDVIANQAKVNAKMQSLIEAKIADLEKVDGINSELTIEESKKADIEQRIAIDENQVDSKISVVEGLSVNVSQYEETIAQTERSIMEKSDAKNQAQNDKANAEAEKAQYLAVTPTDEIDQAIIDGYDSTIAQTEATIAEAEAEENRLRALLAQTEQEKVEAQATIDSVRSEIEELKQSIFKAEAEIEQLSETINRWRSELATVMNSIDDMSKTIEALKSDDSMLQDLKSKLEVDVKKSYETLAKLQKQLKELVAVFGVKPDTTENAGS